MENASTTLQLSEAAARRINMIAKDQNKPGLMMRLEVLGGGCSGFQYRFAYELMTNADEDVVITRDGAKLVVDKTSLEYVKGSEVDYGETIMEAGFRVRNPNAVSSCGCGTSFAVGKE